MAADDLQGLPTVVVADDSPTVRALVRVRLESAGYRVVEAADGRQALDAVAAGGVDVLLLDVEMPVLDGHATITALKADPATAGVPVVFLTARGGGDDVVEALRLGATDYLRKPPDDAELLARVGAALEVARLHAELAQRTAELDRVSRTDHLTGLHNRRHLDEALASVTASARRHAFPYSVLLLDVDHFKRVNDRGGHEAGDVVLQVVAQRLQRGVRAEDLVGRWGGEEFIVLAPHTDVAGARVLAERLRASVAAAPVDTPAGEFAVTVSVGGATTAAPGPTADPLLRAADACLYVAKTSGRDRCEVRALTAAGEPG